MTQAPKHHRNLTITELNTLNRIAEGVPTRKTNLIVKSYCRERREVGMLFRRAAGAPDLPPIRVFVVRDEYVAVIYANQTTSIRVHVGQPEVLAALIKMES